MDRSVADRTRAQLDDNLGCLDFELGTNQKQRLDDASRIELGFPHDFLQQMMPKTVEDHRI